MPGRHPSAGAQAALWEPERRFCPAHPSFRCQAVHTGPRIINSSSRAVQFLNQDRLFFYVCAKEFAWRCSAQVERMQSIIKEDGQCPAHPGEPAEEVVHDHSSNEGLAEAGGQANKCVVQQRSLHYGHLVRPFLHTRWVDPGLRSIPVNHMQRVICRQ